MLKEILGLSWLVVQMGLSVINKFCFPYSILGKLVRKLGGPGAGTGGQFNGQSEDQYSIPSTMEKRKKLSVVTEACDPRAGEKEAGGSLGLSGSPACPTGGGAGQ